MLGRNKEDRKRQKINKQTKTKQGKQRTNKALTALV